MPTSIALFLDGAQERDIINLDHFLGMWQIMWDLAKILHAEAKRSIKRGYSKDLDSDVNRDNSWMDDKDCSDNAINITLSASPSI
jgi:hypothetical protein